MTLGQRLRSSASIALAIAVATAAGPATAQQKSFPSKPVRWVTVGAGSQNDLIARLIAPKLAESWGQPVVIENRTGAGGAFAASTVAKAAPDGYTLLMLSAQFSIGAAIHKNLPYDAVKDFAGVTQIGFSTLALIVPPVLGVKSVKELIAYAQAKPSQILFSSAGAGSSVHMNCERFRLAAGIKAVHVGFKSSPEAVIEVVTGRVQFSMPALGPSMPFIKDGRLLALAVASPQRSPLLPDVPAMGEVIPGYQVDGSFGLLAPAGTPRPVLNQISKDVGRVLEMPDIKERLQAMGFAPVPTTPEEFDRILRADIATFSRVGKLVGLIAK
ncbi:MAG TPA: tripartite tricarboxylate transporter substrate binding protein [Burkholderiales bacterium]|nr:tripartite tricarboxylate transporter substrate binding protein [Burkholderiales bacterium]